MKWNKYTLKTRTEAEDIISSMMMDVGVEGIEIEDKIPLTEQDKAQMFVDIMPIVGEDDGTGNRSNGILSKITGSLNSEGIKKTLGLQVQI